MTVIKGDGVDKSELGLRIFQLTGFAKDNGAHLQYLTDFDDYRNAVEEYSDAGAVTGILDNRISRIGPENGFWVIATNDAAKLIHIQAVRYEYLKGQTLSQHWLNDPAMYAPAWLDIDFHKSDFDTAPITHEITGAVCYHADFWLDKEYRNLELASLLSNYAMVLSLARFNPAYFYGFMAARLVKQGWASRAGYLHIHPWAPRWYISNEDEFYDEYLVWVTGQDLNDLWSSGKRDTQVLGQVAQHVDTFPTVSHAMESN